MANKPERTWRCDECGQYHHYEDDARECCRPSVSEGYLCPECSAFHEDESSALDCCWENEHDGVRPATPQELERDAGQQRLQL